MIRFALLFALAAPATAAETLTISTADCRRLVAHAPRADVTYQGGVDARGKPVVPADVSGAAVELPAFIDIPIALDVARRLSGGTPGDVLSSRRGLEGKGPLGTLTIKGNDAFWNGRQLQSQEEAMLAEACRASLHAHGVVLPDAKPSAPE
jgi:hypothetical protein